MHNLDVHLDFRTQLTRYMSDFEAKRPGYGFLFHSEVTKALQRISTFPLSSTLINGNVRRLNLKRFPCTILYRIEQNNQIFILTVGHLHRGPEFWKSKLNQFKPS